MLSLCRWRWDDSPLDGGEDLGTTLAETPASRLKGTARYDGHGLGPMRLEGLLGAPAD